MFSIKSAFIILGLVATIRSMPLLTIKISMNNYWLFKTISVIPQLNIGDSFVSLDEDIKSSWYIFGDYFNRIVAQTLPVIITTNTKNTGDIETTDLTFKSPEKNVAEPDEVLDINLKCEEHEIPRLEFQELALRSDAFYCKFYLYCFSLGFQKPQPKMLNRKANEEPGKNRRGPVSIDDDFDDEINESDANELGNQPLVLNDSKIVDYHNSYVPRRPDESIVVFSKYGNSRLVEQELPEISKSDSHTIV